METIRRFKCAYVVPLLALLLAGAASTQATVIDAKSASLADVNAAVGSARDGDTVVVPEGTARWTSPLYVTKGITLRGSGIDKTVILDEIPRPNRWGAPPDQRQEQQQQRSEQQQKWQNEQQEQQRQQRWAERETQRSDRGHFFDSTEHWSAGQGNPSIVRVEIPRNHSFRLTGFTFRYGSVTNKMGGSLRLKGISPSVRIDHCHFDQLFTGIVIQLSGWIYGVIDHCIFDIQKAGGGSGVVSIAEDEWGGPEMDHPIYKDTHGHGSWADPSFWGSEKFVFVEDNLINNLSAAPNAGGIDGQRGGRFVVRHNTFHNSTTSYHGSDSGAGGVFYRGTRAVEIYDNTFDSSIPEHPGGQCRGGALLWHDNKYTGTVKNGMGLKIYRLQGPWNKGRGWGAANGTSPWDLNDTEGNGTNVPGHKPHLYLAGKHTGPANSDTLVVANGGWKPNQWVGFSVTNTSTNIVGFVIANTSDTMTLTGGSNAQIKFNPGDSFEIYKVLVVLDQPGRGRSDYIGPSDDPHPVWPHQALEPCYSWNNTLNGKPLNFINDGTHDCLRVNVDFYNDTPMPGYRPYTYPHPLTKQ